jgi:hypothetical protein
VTRDTLVYKTLSHMLRLSLKLQDLLFSRIVPSLKIIDLLRLVLDDSLEVLVLMFGLLLSIIKELNLLQVFSPSRAQGASEAHLLCEVSTLIISSCQRHMNCSTVRGSPKKEVVL